MCEIWLLSLNGLLQYPSQKYWQQFYLPYSCVVGCICHTCAHGIGAKHSTAFGKTIVHPLRRDLSFALLKFSIIFS
jgi:hypothetical protein